MNGQANQQGFVNKIGSQLQTPFSTSMSWTQLAAVVVFVLVVVFAWRQVTLFIGQDIT